MTRRRTAVLLAASLAALTASSAAADGPSEAAVTSFALTSADGVRDVHLVAAREGAGDVLVVRVESCSPRGCEGEDAVLPLADGQLVLHEGGAALEVVLDGRALHVTWQLDEGGLHLSGSRFRSEGPAGQTVATSFAGLSADVQVVLDGQACTTGGALGTGLRLATQPESDTVALGAGALSCAE